MSGLEQVTGSMLLHAGTASKDGQVVTNGGRVLAITSLGADIKEALETCYKNAEQINYEGKYYRKDIGYEFL